MRKPVLLLLLSPLTAGCLDGPPDRGAPLPTGVGETVFTAGEDPDNPFFAELGTNGRTCATCHDQDDGWSVTPGALQARFDDTDGLDPIFRAIDGATSPDADVSDLEARRVAYALLLDKGLIRVGRPIPDGAQFTLTAVADPYGFASADELSLFRRPLPSTNLRFLPAIMWDAREPTLAQQALDATLGHAEAGAFDDPELIAEIVAFESSVFTAQSLDDVAGDLASDGCTGGPQALSTTDFEVGDNDSAAPGFDRDVFTLFAAWRDEDPSTDQGARRASIARGERLFNTRELEIRGVAGIPDQQGTCSTCHDTPNVGNRSRAQPMDLGVSDPDDDTRDLPLYTLTNLADGRVVRTTDPGVALTTGRWNDVGKFEVPVLRGLAMRPPYFHNGMSRDLRAVVRFYIRRFDVRLSDRDEDDLVAFLSAL